MFLERQKTELFSLASHELKNPITTLKLLAQSISKKTKKQKMLLPEIKDLNKELERMTNLVGEMLDISLLETGKIKLNLQPVDIYKLIEGVATRMKLIAGGRKINFNHKAQEKLFVIADRLKIEQVLINLLTNAIKYSADKTLIEIILIKDGKYATVCVKDQGIGITKNKLVHIFDRYYQSSNKGYGFGLGLYLSKNIVEKHKGKIWVQSQLKKGSSFYFSLPLFNIN